MSKLEFLQGLKAELEGRVPHSIIQENLRYYDSYITEEAAKGHTEEEVIEGLGGPKIIARTIVDAALDTEDVRTGLTLTAQALLMMRGQGEDTPRERARIPTIRTPNSTMWISVNGTSG